MTIKLYTFVLSIGAILSIFSCSQEIEESQYEISQTEELIFDMTEEVDSTALDFTFNTFYDKFISDTSFQIERVQFPLKGGLTTYGEETKWTKDDWPYMRWSYLDEMRKSEDSIVSWQNDNAFYFGEFCRDCGFSFWMQFEKIDKKWMLVERQENNF